MAKNPNLGLEPGYMRAGKSSVGQPLGGNTPHGILSPSKLAPHECDTRLGYRHEKGIKPDALPVSGRFNGQGTDGDGPDGRSDGLPGFPPRSGYFGGTDGDYGE